MHSTPGSSGADKAQIWGADDAAPDEGAGERKSLYVEIFDSMQHIVLRGEAHLFSPRERACLERLHALSYPARYLLIRLCLRKRGKWHALAALAARYASELGDAAAVAAAAAELCGAPPVAEQEVIDLTLDDDAAGPSGPREDDELAVFAREDGAASVPDLLGCLPLDGLKAIAKEMKLARPAQNRTALIDAILAHASRQSTLNFPVLGTPRARLRQRPPDVSAHGTAATQHAVVRRLVATQMGRCVRIEPAVFALFDRLNLVFFRSTTYSTALLLPALLKAFRKRNYGSVRCEYQRTPIFPSRAALLAYEEALVLEARVDEILGGEAQRTRAQRPAVKGKGKAKAEDDAPAESSRVEGARAVRDILWRVHDRWGGLVACKDEKKRAGLERFDCGHVLTRIVCKGAQALGILKEYELEIQVLRELLAQTKWRRGRRGGWYDRLALIFMTHCERTPENLEAAMDVVIRALEDDSTHMTYRPRLQRRLARLENMLKLPKDQRHKCDGRLQKAHEVWVEGVRLYQTRAASIVLARSGGVKRSTESPSKARALSQTPLKLVMNRAATQAPERAQSEAPKGKTIWLGRNKEDVSVEQLALEYYEDLGFKGFHSEGRIVSTLFGLLFWDIIFAPIAGAFETPYQSAPLDIFEDGFYSARVHLIDQRLKELENGEARDIIQRVDERERPEKTWCIGVDWQFEREDLLEIVQCLGGAALHIICRTIAEDYGQRGGGVPDLFVWNAEDSTCKFVEVKSPNDTLQENQKVWIDVLLGSGTAVELCHVMERGAERKFTPGRQAKKKKAAVEAPSSDLESEDETEMDAEGEGNFNVLPSSQEEGDDSKAGRRARDSDGFLPSPKRRKVEVVLTPRKRRKG